MLENKLHEELMRHKAINKYGSKMIMEQDAPAELPAEEPALPELPEIPAEEPATDVAPVTDVESPEIDSTEEVDITDLVNMTKSIKHDLENGKQDNSAVITKMDDVFSKLSELESKLSEMDQVVAKIDQLGAKVEQMKPETPQEKLEMRSLDSYPFNQKPNDFFSQKQEEMKASGKNEYVLTKDDVDNYSFNDIKTSFKPEDETDEIKY